MNDFICTSDCKRFSILALHRIFSATHPKTRSIPRFFLVDCCSGSNQQKVSVRADEELETDMDEKTAFMKRQNTVQKGIDEFECPKQVMSDDVGGNSSNMWMKGERNPDYRLGLVKASNPGFISKLRVDLGSYVIYSFYEKIMEALRKNKRTFLFKTFDNITDELHQLGKQHPTCIWNEDTKYIRFVKSMRPNNSAQYTNISNNQTVEMC